MNLWRWVSSQGRQRQGLERQLSLSSIMSGFRYPCSETHHRWELQFRGIGCCCLLRYLHSHVHPHTHNFNSRVKKAHPLLAEISILLQQLIRQGRNKSLTPKIYSRTPKVCKAQKDNQMDKRKRQKKNPLYWKGQGTWGMAEPMSTKTLFLAFLNFLRFHILLAFASTLLDIIRNEGLPSSMPRCSKCQGPGTTARQHMAAGH